MNLDFGNVSTILFNNQQVGSIDINGVEAWRSQVLIPFYVQDISGSANTLYIVKNSNRALNLTVEKSLDGENWETIGTTSTTEITATIPANGKLYLRCSTNFWAFLDTMGLQYNHISTSNLCNVGGNIMSLLYGSQFTGGETTFPSGYQQGGEVFRYLFGHCDKLVSASNLVLPVTILTEEYCYANMFQNCTVLTTAPMLPATTLTRGCYSQMFWGCTSLNSIKCLATDISVTDCLRSWVQNVPSGGTFTKKAGVTYPSGVSGIPTGWTVIEV